MGISPSEFLVREIRRRRVAANMTQIVLAQRTFCSDSHISNIEQGKATPDEKFLRLLDEALETSGFFVNLWQELVRDAASPVWLREWLEYEREALTLRGYEPAFVPGLLQTEAYARALLRIGGLSGARLDEKVAERLSRQAILDRETPPELFLVLDEMVLRRRCGGHDVMSHQVEHLLAQMERPNVHVNLIPVDHGIYPGLQGSFVIADLSSGLRAGYIDNQLDAQVFEGQVDVARLGVRWDGLTSEALPGRQTLDMVREVAKSWM
ncbi:helix-turn-helix transcriptional regulator [Micromonospora sp. NBC_01699]|uniref:helix-turn-helix domain-containing protein n=1 Tax=Micromonospora sp. NBC_01699 TaxID=2975984 RepID=UPI002E28439C|nr:helix-turn-helix transcriptional regulator [Micromonospora sp. NBC_01699]